MKKSLLVLMALAMLSYSSAYPGEDNLTIEPGDLNSVHSPEAGIPTGNLIADVQNINDGIIAGANYLRDMQADITDDNANNGTNGVDENPDDPDDGGWDWEVSSSLFHHTTSPSPTNIYGATALGLYYAYLTNPDATYLTALYDAADHAVAEGPTVIRSARDLIFLMKFDELAENPGNTYMDAAKAKYDSRISELGSAQILAETIRDYRHNSGYNNGIIAWDIGAFVVAAVMLDLRYPGNGYDADADAMAEVMYQDSFNSNPGYFDIELDQGWDPGYGNPDYYMYTLGISGIIDAFSAAGVHSETLSRLFLILSQCRYPSGAYSYCYGANTGDEDWQSSAYAVLTLAEYDRTSYQSSINETALWMAATQHVSGGFVYSDNTHTPEVGGECTAAMAFGIDAAVPTLSEWAMLIMGLLLLATGTVAVIRLRRESIDNLN